MKKKKLSPPRNWFAVAAHFRKAGSHKDAKKEQARKACRKKIKYNP